MRGHHIERMRKDYELQNKYRELFFNHPFGLEVLADLFELGNLRAGVDASNPVQVAMSEISKVLMYRLGLSSADPVDIVRAFKAVPVQDVSEYL